MRWAELVASMEDMINTHIIPVLRLVFYLNIYQYQILNRSKLTVFQLKFRFVLCLLISLFVILSACEAECSAKFLN